MLGQTTQSGVVRQTQAAFQPGSKPPAHHGPVGTNSFTTQPVLAHPDADDLMVLRLHVPSRTAGALPHRPPHIHLLARGWRQGWLHAQLCTASSGAGPAAQSNDPRLLGKQAVCCVACYPAISRAMHLPLVPPQTPGKQSAAGELGRPVPAGLQATLVETTQRRWARHLASMSAGRRPWPALGQRPLRLMRKQCTMHPESGAAHLHISQGIVASRTAALSARFHAAEQLGVIHEMPCCDAQQQREERAPAGRGDRRTELGRGQVEDNRGEWHTTECRTTTAGCPHRTPAAHLWRASMPIHSAQASLWMSICHGSSLHACGRATVHADEEVGSQFMGHHHLPSQNIPTASYHITTPHSLQRADGIQPIRASMPQNLSHSCHGVGARRCRRRFKHLGPHRHADHWWDLICRCG